jgi:LuxR family maltose regulon positive regulatory protein
VSGDLIERTRLLAYLNTHSDRPFTLVSAPAGYGKTMLLAQWLERPPFQAAWLSLDENDNDLVNFLSYFIAAIQTLFPKGCSTTQNLLSASQIPPLEYLTTVLINEIIDLPEEFLLVLDDYHLMTHQDIHQVMSALIQYAPSPLHLAIASRKDPPFSISRPRAAQKITEVRMNDLRFTSDEVQSYLKLCMGVDISPETVTVLVERTEGWAVGLRMACLSLRGQDDAARFLETFQGTHQYIMEYLVDEILSRQPEPVQRFLLCTAILDRFCAPLGNVLLETMPTLPEMALSDGQEQSSSKEILAQLERDNLFVVSLDQQGEWFRYHHLFKDLLWHKLKAETTPAQRAALNTAASAWLDKNDFIEEALCHYFAANDTAAAAYMVSRQRYTLMNQAQWQWLEQRLYQFSPDILDQYPDLLMLKIWLIYHRGQWAELPAALQQVETALAQASLTPEETDHLQGEMSALLSLLLYHSNDPKNALAHAKQALEKTPRELWSARILARLFLAGVLQIAGDSNAAYAAIYHGFEEEETQSNMFKATLVMTVCYVHWVDADLKGMAQAAKQCITLSQQSDSPQILNYGHYHLGRVCYLQNDLIAAEQHFATVVRQPYLNYGDCIVHSACGLALTYQIQGRPDEAQAVIDTITTFLLETGNASMMPLIQALQAEIALRQGQIAAAGQWAAHVDPIPPLSPMVEFFIPHLTLIKIWLAQDTPASRQKAADLLDTARAYVESTHNTRFLIEVLALQAMQNVGQDERQIALELLAQAIDLAQPGGFIRPFVDLGPQMAGLLAELKYEDSGKQQYVSKILTVFEKDKGGRMRNEEVSKQTIHPSSFTPHPLVESLTTREQDVLECLQLTDKEISQCLVISSHTVRTHIKGIFGKLNVANRRQAIARARELGLLEE